MSNVISIELSDEVKKQLDEVAEYLKKTPNAVVLQAIERYLAEEIEEIRFLQETDKITHRMETTGEGCMTFEEFSKSLGV